MVQTPETMILLPFILRLAGRNELCLPATACAILRKRRSCRRKESPVSTIPRQATALRTNPCPISNCATAAAAARPPPQTWTLPDLCAAYKWPTGLPGGGVIAIVELGGGWVQSDMDAFFQSIGQPSPADHRRLRGRNPERSQPERRLSRRSGLRGGAGYPGGRRGLLCGHGQGRDDPRVLVAGHRLGRAESQRPMAATCAPSPGALTKPTGALLPPRQMESAARGRNCSRHGRFCRLRRQRFQRRRRRPRQRRLPILLPACGRLRRNQQVRLPGDGLERQSRRN